MKHPQKILSCITSSIVLCRHRKRVSRARSKATLCVPTTEISVPVLLATCVVQAVQALPSKGSVRQNTITVV
jgi:hypothetical protein